MWLDDDHIADVFDDTKPASAEEVAPQPDRRQSNSSANFNVSIFHVVFGSHSPHRICNWALESRWMTGWRLWQRGILPHLSKDKTSVKAWLCLLIQATVIRHWRGGAFGHPSHLEWTGDHAQVCSVMIDLLKLYSFAQAEFAEWKFCAEQWA